MATILQVLVSPRPQSWSRRVADNITRRIAELRPGAVIVTRDLAADPPPHPGHDFYEAILSLTPDGDPRFALSECYIAELEAADFVVIGTPMNNFTVPSTLKAWIDHIVRIRRTFRSTPEGKIGLLRDRPLIVTSARGGYVTTPPHQPDFLTSYLRAIFETIGIPSVAFLPLEGMARGPEAVARALDATETWIDQRLPAMVAAASFRTDPTAAAAGG
ncbi:MAG TPA: NAD(P)H-dependent oxidoreductase [Stellaceae bacterium]|jgi:FMN-dependent NADH-azoreductase